MRIRVSCIALPLAALLLSAAGAVHADQEVYQWTDANGVVHYSDRPVEGAQRTGIVYRNTDREALERRRMQQEYQANEEAIAMADQEEEAAAEATRKANEASARELQCDAARQRYEVYTTAPRLYESLPDGERRYLTEAELTAAREQAEADVEQWCD